jgi:hypothetical protein
MTQSAVWIIELFNSEIPAAEVWSTRVALCKAVQAFVEKCTAVPLLVVPETNISQLWDNVKIVAGDRGYESVRSSAARTVAEFVGWVGGHSEWVSVQEKIKLDLPGIIAAETSSVIRAEYTKGRLED